LLTRKPKPGFSCLEKSSTQNFDFLACLLEYGCPESSSMMDKNVLLMNISLIEYGEIDFILKKDSIIYI
jgi:hypothetical protein